MNPSITPFSCVSSPNFAELLWELGCSLAITTYQAGKVVFISATSRDKIVQLPRSFDRAMGMNFFEDKMVLATSSEVIVLKNAKNLALNYQNKRGVYDALYLPRTVYKTGKIDMHDIHLGSDGKIYGVNTLFSCIVEINSEFSFNPIWKPWFVEDLAPEDRCHLNGLIVLDNKPRFCTALGQTNARNQWLENIEGGGVLIDIEENRILLENLSMPHSPIWHNEKIIFVESAAGRINQYDPKTGQTDVIYSTERFVRGLSVLGDYLFVGLSKIRPNGSFFKSLDIMKNSTESGLMVIHLPTKSVFSNLNYRASVDEIYDVCVIPDSRRPNILNTDSDLHQRAITLDGKDYWAGDKLNEPQISK